MVAVAQQPAVALCHLATVAVLLGAAAAGSEESHWVGSAAPPAPLRSKLAPPPPFGHELRDEFMFDPNTTNFNHGSYGGTPTSVFEQQIAHVRFIEGFIITRIAGGWYRDHLEAVRKRIATYIGAPWEDTVLVDNASNALNVLLNMWRFQPDEVILDFSTAYSNFQNTYRWVQAARNVSTVTVPFTFPLAGPDVIVDSLHDTLAQLKANNTKVGVAIISQVSSWPAILLPVSDLVAILKSEGIPSIVDGAHALGATPVNLAALGSPEFWFGNGHKWLYTPKSTCALYVNKTYQTKTWPEPTVVDSFGDAFADRYVWDGTRDRSAFLAMSDAMDFRAVQRWRGVDGEGVWHCG
jgi:selenocysteine lyase/cysteine desulfurase